MMMGINYLSSMSYLNVLYSMFFGKLLTCYTVHVGILNMLGFIFVAICPGYIHRLQVVTIATRKKSSKIDLFHSAYNTAHKYLKLKIASNLLVLKVKKTEELYKKSQILLQSI